MSSQNLPQPPDLPKLPKLLKVRTLHTVRTFGTLRKLSKPSRAEGSRLARPGLVVILVAIAIVITIAFLGLMETMWPMEPSSSNSKHGEVQLQAAAADPQADPQLPGDATTTATATVSVSTGTPTTLPLATVTPTSTDTAEPDMTESPIPISTIVRPTRTTAATATRIPTSVLTAIAATQIAHTTNVAANRQAIATSVALTHAPTITPGPPPAYPSPTPIMGILPGCGNTSSSGPQAYSCWRGIVDGDVVEVYAGREGRNGDRMQGILWVYVRGQGQQEADIYQTPQRVGAVRIASVNGILFTLETVDQTTPQVFVFDLATRTWVSP